MSNFLGGMFTRTIQTVKPHVPLIKFRKGGLNIQGAGHSSRAEAPLAQAPPKGSSKVLSRPLIEDYQLPVRYGRLPMDQAEIDAINDSLMDSAKVASQRQLQQRKSARSIHIQHKFHKANLTSASAAFIAKAADQGELVKRAYLARGGRANLHRITADAEKAVMKEKCDQPQTITARLRKQLFCGYNSAEQPTRPLGDPTIIRLFIAPFAFDYLWRDRMELIAVWNIIMKWRDDFLQWNPSDYEGIQQIYVEASEIWIPNIFVKYPFSMESSFVRSMSCQVQFNGTVSCFSISSIKAHCNVDLIHYPGERHACKIVLSPHYYKGGNIKLDFLNEPVNDRFKNSRVHGSWKIVDLKSERIVTLEKDSETSSVELQYSFFVERYSLAHDVILSTPTLVVILMSLSVFWLDVQCSARIILSGITIGCDLYVLKWFMQNIPPYFNHIPIIVLVIRHCLLLTGLSLAWSAIARFICLSSSSPFWLHALSSRLSSHKLKVLLPHDSFVQAGIMQVEEETEAPVVIPHSSPEPRWRLFVLVIDRLLFGLYSLIYIYLYMSLSL